MECTCGSEERQRRRSIKLRRKYDLLKKQHKKLLGVTIELTQVLEEYVRGKRAPNVSETLTLCEKIYPSLFDELSERTRRMVVESKVTHGKEMQKDDNMQEKLQKEELNHEVKNPVKDNKKRNKSEERMKKSEELLKEENNDIANEEIVEEFVDGLRKDLRKSAKKIIKKELLAMAEEEYYDGFWSKKELPRTPFQ